MISHQVRRLGPLGSQASRSLVQRPACIFGACANAVRANAGRPTQSRFGGPIRSAEFLEISCAGRGEVEEKPSRQSESPIGVLVVMVVCLPAAAHFYISWSIASPGKFQHREWPASTSEGPCTQRPLAARPSRCRARRSNAPAARNAPAMISYGDAETPADRARPWKCRPTGHDAGPCPAHLLVDRTCLPTVVKGPYVAETRKSCHR